MEVMCTFSQFVVLVALWGEKGVQLMKRVVDNSGKQSFVGSFTHVVK